MPLIDACKCGHTLLDHRMFGNMSCRMCACNHYIGVHSAMPLVHLHDASPAHHFDAPPGYSKGLIPRNYSTHPVGYLACAKPFDIPLIPRSEWQARADLLTKNKGWLSDLRNTSGPNGGPIPSRDQNQKGYCWAHSSTSASLIVRAKQGEPYADLSAYAVACIIKQFRDEGGWGSESLEFIASRGIPTSQFWPQKSMDRANDNPNTWANAALHKFTEWMDLEPNNQDQLVTCLLLGIPVVTDFNWWSHSVCTLDLVSISPFSIRIWNSWGDSWSENGTGVLSGQKASPDGQIAPRVMTPSLKTWLRQNGMAA